MWLINHHYLQIMSFKIQHCILIASVLFYGSIAYIFASKTLLPYHPKYIHDLYLGFDNSFQNTSFLKHPLLKIITIAFKVKSLSENYLGYILVAICVFFISLQNLLVYQYLSAFRWLKTLDKILVVSLFGISSTNLILGFTFESYVFSSFFLTLLLYYSISAKRHSKYHTLLFSVIIGGVTITNALKVFFLSKAFNVKTYIKFASVGFFSLVLGGFAFWDKIKFSVLHNLQFLDYNSHYWKDIFYYFLGGIIVFPNLKQVSYHYESKELIPIVIADYPGLLSFKTFLISVFWGLILIAFIKNYSKSIVKSLTLCFGIDVFIHCVLKFGLSEAMIFGGNFVFIFPVFFAFLLNDRNATLFRVVIFLLIILLGVINLHELNNLFSFGTRYYPKT